MKLEKPVSDELWEEIQQLLPPTKPRRFKNAGRKPIDTQRALAGILYVLRTGIPWVKLPQELGCGSGSTCQRYLHRWLQLGIWERIHEILLAKLPEADKIDFSRAVSSSVRVVKEGQRPRIAGKQNMTSLLKLSVDTIQTLAGS